MQGITETAAPTSGAQCAVHVGVPAVDTCSRCGNFVCADCMDVHQWETFCHGCATKLGHKGAHSPRAVAALVCGLLPLFVFCVPAAIPAVILGHMEIAAIDRGEAPASGRNLAKGGLILGWITIGLSAFAGLIGLLILIAD